MEAVSLAPTAVNQQKFYFELESMKTDGTTEAEAKDFLHPFLQQVCAYPHETIERVLNPLRDLNEMHSGMFDEEVNMLKRKLGVRNYNPTASIFPLMIVKMPTLSFPRLKNISRVKRRLRIWQCL